MAANPIAGLATKKTADRSTAHMRIERKSLLKGDFIESTDSYGSSYLS